MDNMENKNENVQDQQNAPVDGEYSFFYGHKPEDEQSNSQQAPKAEPEVPKADKSRSGKSPARWSPVCSSPRCSQASAARQ